MDYITSIINVSNMNYTKKNKKNAFKNINCKPKNLTSKNISHKRKKNNSASCLDTKTVKLLKKI